MSFSDKATNFNNIETIENELQERPEALEPCWLTNLPSVEKNNTFSLNHKNPELQAVMTQAELTNIDPREFTQDAIDASFIQARNLLVDHFATKLSALPEEVRDSFIKSLDLESHYKPSFPLHTQIHKSSLFA